MSQQPGYVCGSGELHDGGKAVRFFVQVQGEELPAFAVRHQGKVCAYLNQCAHIPVEMDFQEGEFFDDSGEYLVCATHGALYQPDTGKCVAGPCAGASLRAVPIVEDAGAVVVDEAALSAVRLD